MRFSRVLSAVAALCLASTAFANEPAPVSVSIGSGLTLAGTSYVHLQNLEGRPLVLLLSAGPLSSIPFTSKRVTINPGVMDVDLGVLTIPTGQQTFHIVARVFDGTQNLPAGLGPSLLEQLQVTSSNITKISYEQAYLSKRVAVTDAANPANDRPAIDLGGAFIDHRGIAALAFRSSPVGGRGLSYNVPNSPVTMSNAFLCFNADHFPRNCPTKPSVGTVGFGSALGIPLVPTSPPPPPGRELRSGLPPAAGERNTTHPRDPDQALIQGKFFLKLPGPVSRVPSPVYQAAWGWQVKVWENFGSGYWSFQGSTYVGTDGSWAVAVLPHAASALHIEYQPANRFVQLQDPNTNVYTWTDDTTLQGTVIDIGGRCADFTASGDLPGVDKLYVGAVNEWVKFYNNGLNALRDTPIEITFPNSLASGVCPSTDAANNPIAWSCSLSASGKIWIIPEHGDISVVQHEIGHSINAYYWNGVLATGSGGKHDLDKCYNNGVGLSEGFADFIAYWVQFDRTATSPTVSYYNTNIETLPRTCAGQSNEMRVAATLWDTYDLWNDGLDDHSKFDSLYYNNQADPVSLILTNKKDAMEDYLAIVQSGQPAAVQDSFARIFRLNAIVP